LLVSFASCGFWTQDTSYGGTTFTARSGHTAVKPTFESAIIYGGAVMNGYANPVTYFQNEIWTFHHLSNTMDLDIITGLVPSNRSFHMAVDLPNGDMLVWGGGAIVGFSFVPSDTNMWIYHRLSKTFEEKVPLGTVPSGRLGAAMARIGGQVYLFGGINTLSGGSCCGFLNDMYVYTIDTNTWATLTPATVPSPRGHSGVNVQGTSIWLQGGEGTSFAIQTGLWKYESLLNNWYLVNLEDPDVNQRESQMFNRIGDTLITFSGDHEGPNFYNLLIDTELYFIPNGVWMNVTTSDRPPAGKRMPSVDFGREVFFFGQNTNLNPATGVDTDNNEIWFYTQPI